jgi:hypothetical protein
MLSWSVDTEIVSYLVLPIASVEGVVDGLVRAVVVKLVE